jgi:di/tricarboxylate transporter
MGFEAWYAIGVVVATMAVLTMTRIGPDLVLVGALTLLLVAGVLTPVEALAGLANPGLATVAILYVVVSGMIETGAAHTIGHRLLGRPKSELAAQGRLMGSVMGVSAFLNNTPVVAMLIPTVQDWARKNGFQVSRLMIPLSYAAILGGTCTVIGTSTNLVVAGLVDSHAGMARLGFFEIAWVGVPTAIAGTLFVLATSRWLLPSREPPIRHVADAREYAVEMVVEPRSPLAGRSIEQAGLRRLPGVFLAEIEREGHIMVAVAPTEILRGQDRLVFVGGVDSVVDLYKIKGLVPAPDQVFKLDVPRPDRLLIEAVVSTSSPMVGTTIRDGRFRTRYEAVVIAVARGGQRIPGRIGDISLRGGDTLLLEARPAFVERNRRSRDFFLISAVQGSSPPRHERAIIALAILAGMVAAVSVGGVPMLIAALVAAGLMLVLRCTTGPIARRSIDWQVLTVIAASIALGTALETTGAAASIASAWLSVAGDSPLPALAVVYILTSLLSAFITNNGAAVLVFPLAVATAGALGVNPRPFVIAIMMAASASFATPIGYQTNLMVYGPGGYRFSDYLRIGLPLTAILAAVALLVVPRVWPF